MATLPTRILGIIPARGGSKRVPRKNLRLLGGKPVVARSIETALASRRLSRVVVSSDDDEVLEIARRYDPSLVLRRPKELCGDTSPAIDFVRHALATTAAAGDDPFDVVAIIQPSSPLTETEDVDGVLDLLAASGAESAVSVVELEHALHPLKLKTLVGDRLLPYLEDERLRMAAHELPRIYVRNGSVYATVRRVHETGKILGDDCRGYVMPRVRSLDVNDELDWDFATFLFERMHSATSGAGRI
jgi:CMP-N,N'-diacetyllegionaminic acid synthase